MRVHLEQEDTQEKRLYDDLKADQISINDNAWAVAEKIVRRRYTDDDVEKHIICKINLKMFRLLQKIVAFILIILVRLKRDYDNNVKIVEKPMKNILILN